MRAKDGRVHDKTSDTGVSLTGRYGACVSAVSLSLSDVSEGEFMCRLTVVRRSRLMGGSLIYLLLFVAGILAGCGSSSEEFVHTGASGEVGFAPISVAGRVVPGVPAAGVPVVVSSDDGSILARATTDGSGSFLFPGFAGPRTFRVSAAFDDGLVLESLVTNNTGGAFVVLNIPTTLASRLAAFGNFTPDQAKQRVAEFLGLSSVAELEHGLSEFQAGGFSHLAFFVRAQQQGGISALLNRLSEEIDRGAAPQPFRATSQDLEAALSVPEALAAELQRVQKSPLLRRAVEAARLHELPQIGTLALDGTTHAQPKAVNTDIRAMWIVDTLLDQTLDVAWTHIADGANLNYGTTAMLERIQGQLEQVLDTLATITLTLDRDKLDQAINTVYNDAISQIDTYNSRLANLTLSAILANPETPYTPADDTRELLGTLQSLTTEQSLRIIRSYLEPGGQGTKILVDGQAYILSTLYGQGLTADVGNFPFRTQDLYNQLFSIFEYYSQYQQLGINLLGESAHIQTNPTSALRTAQDNAEDTILSLYRQRAVLPPGTKLPANVVVDLQAGLMWYTSIVGARSTSDAVAYADSFTLANGAGGYYSDWHVPTLEEYRVLRERARLVSSSLRDGNVKHNGDNASEGNFGYSSQGLTALGFVNANILDSDGAVLYANYLLAQMKDPADDHYFLDGTSWNDPNFEFRFNHENSDERSTTQQRPFFLVRSIGKPVVRIDSRHDVDSTTAPPPYEWSEVQDFEYEMFGRVSGIAKSHFLTPAGSTSGLPDRVGADLTYSFATGGTLAIGGSPYRLTFPRRFHDSAAKGLSFPTYNGPSSAYTTVNTRNQLVSFSTTTAEVGVAPTGRLRWRAGGSGPSDLDLTANFYNLLGEEQSFQQRLSTSVSSPRKLVQIQMFPRNREYFLTSASSRDEQYYCLAFYSDDTVEEVTKSPTIVWTAVDNSTGEPLPASAFFSSQSKGYFTVRDTAPQFVKLSVSLGPTPAENDQTVVKAVTQ